MKDRMTGVEAFLRQLDDAWEHKWESLSTVLAAVAEKEAEWQAPCYESEEQEKGWSPPGTIRWQVAHIAHCKRHYTDFIKAPGSSERPPVPTRKPTESFDEDRKELRSAHAGERDAIASLSESHLELPVGNGMRLDIFLAMAIRHDTWHAAQIAVVRRLWRTR